jgi:hypothetical protein
MYPFYLSKLKRPSLRWHPPRIKSLSRSLKLSSSACALTGGILLASNTVNDIFHYVLLNGD